MHTHGHSYAVVHVPTAAERSDIVSVFTKYKKWDVNNYYDFENMLCVIVTYHSKNSLLVRDMCITDALATKGRLSGSSRLLNNHACNII
jgi:hypothetical protein